MKRIILAVIAAATPAVPLVAQVQDFELTKPGLDSQARCAALFAIVANEQRRKAPGSDRFPPMAEEGREFFVLTGIRLKEERGLDEVGVKGFFVELVGAIHKEYAAASDAGAKLDKEMATCLAIRDGVIPPKPAG